MTDTPDDAAPITRPPQPAPATGGFDFGALFQSVIDFFKNIFHSIFGGGNSGSEQPDPSTQAPPTPGAPAPAPQQALSHDKALAMVQHLFFSPQDDPHAKLTVTTNADGSFTYRDGDGHFARARETMQQLSQEAGNIRRDEMAEHERHASAPCPYSAGFVCRAHGYSR